MSGSFTVRTFVVPFLVLASPAFADNWADQVISYNPGTNPATGYTDPQTALGEPSRFTGTDPFAGAVTPFNSAYLPTQIVSLGVGGSLVLKFDQPVTNDAAHPFGIDFIVFGNAFYNDPNYPAGITDGTLGGAGAGRIEVSSNGSNWFTMAGVAADSAYPTLGYSDLTDPYSPLPGSVLSDFTRPVNPAFVATNGTTFAQIVAAYDGSGGGTGVDIGAAGQSSISYVRISNPNASGTVEIDALSRVAVPAPGAAALLLLAPLARRRRTGVIRR